MTRWCLGLLLLSSAVAVDAAAPTSADCDREQASRVLAPVHDDTPHARAAWLDARHLRWPGKQADGRYRLHHAAGGGLRLQTGSRVRGADAVLALDPVAGPLAQDTEARFAYLGEGATLRLADADADELPVLLRGQLVLVEEDAEGQVIDATRVQLAAALDALYAGAEALTDLGVTVESGQARFRLWAPTARAVSVCLYPGEQAAASGLQSLRRDAGTGAWSASIAGEHSGGYYTYLVDVFVPGTGVVRNRVTDPYAISLGTDSRRAYAASLDDPALMPPGWAEGGRGRELAAATDMAIYELHVRDFSASDASVPAAHRGKYLAFTDTASDGMRHLRGLAEAGLTDVHLLPVFDLASVPERGCTTPAPSGPPDGESQQAAVMAAAAGDCYNWGYDPFHYTAPEGSYATDPGDGAVRVRELRAMVQALHGIGLRVGMDVVYNHTSASGQAAHSVLDRIVPGYYQRLDAKGGVERSTCCDNTATENRMMAKLMIDSAVTWARDYRIDSFRFDLMGHQPRAAMERLQAAVDRAAGQHIDLLGEGWNFGEIADGRRFVQASQLSLAGSGIASFSDRARDAVRGGGCCDRGETLVLAKGYVNGLAEAASDGAGRNALLQAADRIRLGLAGTLRGYVFTDHTGRQVRGDGLDYEGQPAGYAATPGEVVNYVENHDNQTLYDLDALKLPPGTPSGERARVQLLAAAVVAFSQGIAYTHAGFDLLRSKSLDKNSFDSGDWFNRLDWSLADNHYGIGLPPAPDNGDSWDVMRPRLADPSVKPSPGDIRWMRDAYRDLLRIRGGSRLFRLRSEAEVVARLRFPNTGPDQVGSVLAGLLDGEGLAGAGFAQLAYFINVGTSDARLVLPETRGKPFRLHPVQAAATAADARPRERAGFDRDSGSFTIPARTAVVYVLD